MALEIELFVYEDILRKYILEDKYDEKPKEWTILKDRHLGEQHMKNVKRGRHPETDQLKEREMQKEI